MLKPISTLAMLASLTLAALAQNQLTQNSAQRKSNCEVRQEKIVDIEFL